MLHAPDSETTADHALREPYVRGALSASMVWSLRYWLLAGVFLLAQLTSSVPARFLIAVLTMASLYIVVIRRKAIARERCNIIFLRGFRQEARANVPNRALPCIGCYGRILRLKNVVKVVDEPSQANLSSTLLTDADEQPAPQGDWKGDLSALLRQADVAVIDFSVLSESLFWEIDQSLAALTEQRIILIAEFTPFARPNYLKVCQRFPALWDAPTPFPIYPSRFVIPRNIFRWWFFQFERRMYKCMSQVAAGTVATIKAT